MRITGGRIKGKTLASFKGVHIRPTSDQVREAIFNILGHDLQGKTVLDLFCGTGILGIESLSRGAARAIFVDKSKRSVNLVKKNLELCGLKEYGVVLQKDLRRGLSFLSKLDTEKFNLVFLDPPYKKGLATRALNDLSKGKVLAPRAKIVVETSRLEKLSDFNGLKLQDYRTYGDTKIHFYFYGEIEK